MKEVDANRQAWSLLTQEHYEHYLEILKKEQYKINPDILSELGDISGKRVIHLQCNTGADTISLARMGAAMVTGVDLVTENVEAAKKMASELGVTNVGFIASDIMELSKIHFEKYDIVFTTEGALIWLPDKNLWAKTVAGLLNKGGFLYVCDAHPFYYTFDEEDFAQGRLTVAYPYFKDTPDSGSTIGGYAAEPKEAENYSWMYTVSIIINNLIQAGLSIEFFNEHEWYMCDSGNMERVGDNYYSRYFRGKIPMMFSVKARLNQ